MFTLSSRRRCGRYQWVAMMLKYAMESYHEQKRRLLCEDGFANQEMGRRGRQAENQERANGHRGAREIRGTAQDHARYPRCRIQETGGTAWLQRIGVAKFGGWRGRSMGLDEERLGEGFRQVEEVTVQYRGVRLARAGA